MLLEKCVDDGGEGFVLSPPAMVMLGLRVRVRVGVTGGWGVVGGG